MADSLFMAEASHSVYVNRLASEEVNKLNQFWGSYYRLLQNALGDYDSDMTRRQFNALIKTIDTTITESMEEWQHQLMLDLDEFAEYESDFQARMIGAFTDADIAVPAPAQVISAAIETPISLGQAGAISLNPWLADISNKQKQRIENEIKLGYANGRTNADMVRAIVGTKSNKFTDGIADIDRRSAVTLVRTATNHYASTARKKVYEQNKRVVIGHVWVSTLDKRTSDICIGLDGKELYYDKGEVRYPPAHPGCRSSTSPIVKGRKPIPDNSQRASKGGELKDGKLITDPKPVSSKLTYLEWLKTQPAQFQDAVLGKTKGKIFRNSGVSVDKFSSMLVDRVGKPLTIKDMAAKDKMIEEYLQSAR
ncbi:phage minor head protein [Shewanella chilikensis]|uniref:phage minor head protein n=1 Tax=Shewanella chilikensis TaxID=558541 RepID=UPI003A9802E1